MESTTSRGYKEKSVIIHRDENGFGLRVGGQNPVFVDCVHENGAAWKAGVRKDDRIIKVNGTLVRLYDHQRVVQMIQNCTPFVNLTLHSPETDSYSLDVSASTLGQTSSDQNILGTGGLHHSHSSNNISMNNNSISINSNPIQVHPMLHHDHLHGKLTHNPYPHNHRQHHNHQRRHHSNPHSMSSNWLLEIGDDLFQDNHHIHSRASVPMNKSHQLQMNPELIPTTSNHGVSKLIVSGPNPLASSSTNSINNGGKDLRLSKQQQQQANNIRDNPYYYYKTAPEKISDATSCNTSSTAPLLSSQSNQDQQQQATSAKATTSLSVVRSRSSSKMSIRSTTGKYKPRNLRSRLVEDLRALTITNNSQITPSSLSTSPSSSDLSECDDLETSRLDCLTLNNNSALSNSPGGGGGTPARITTNANANSSPTATGSIIIKSKITTRRLEIIKELVETEKTHLEKLKQLNDLLYKPIKAENLIPPDQLKMVFSCHKTLFKIHRQIYKKLVAAQINVSEVHQEPLVGKALIEIFDGELGKRLEKAASLFCACQSTNSDLLNRITRKDTKSGEFLAQVANQQMLGRLGIKDLLASCFQRLTKYPLLLDNLLKATPNTGSSGMMHSKSLSEGSIAVCATIPPSINDPNVTATHEEAESRPDSQQQFVEQSSAANQSNITSATVSRSNSGASESTEESENETNDETITKNSSAISPIITTIKASTSTICANNTSVLSNYSNSTSSDEYAYERLCIERALHLSRQILIHVNEAVNKAIAQNKLRDVWKKTVFLPPPPDKSEEKKTSAIPVIDIETQQLLHEGSLTLRLARRSYEVYVVLLTHYLVILTREGQDKYKLKYFTSDAKSTQQFFSPVFNIDEHLVTRDSATDENGFYLLCKRKDDSRIYEFASQSPADRAKWKEKIHLAQLYNFAAVPEDDNTLTRYTELISLANDPVDETGLDEKLRQ
uniref:Rho guanine nucleotide exchange factor 1 n=1 Tax=Aceria tosichella TaxID=561515 RepID=A0A6G1S6J2_9ACAR